MEIKEICPTTAQVWLKEGAILLDVREQHELDELSYDVPGMLHIPLSDFEERFHEVPKNKDVVLACRSGARSLRATGFLMNHGYDNVVNMKMGIIRWVDKGFPTKGLASVVSSDGGCCDSSSSKKTASSGSSCLPKESAQPNAECCDSSSSNQGSCC